MIEKSKTKFTLKQLIFLALLTAINVVVSRLFIIPVPMTHGNINFCDAGIFIVALIFGTSAGAVVGGLSGFMLDLFSGYGQYMLFSLLVHGLEGALVGVTVKYLPIKGTLLKNILAMSVGIIIMVLGYFAVDSILYTLSAGAIGTLTNTFQGVAGAVIALLIIPAVKRIIAGIR